MNAAAKILHWTETHFDALQILLVPALIFLACMVYGTP